MKEINPRLDKIYRKSGVSPFREMGEYILYTEEEGGEFRILIDYSYLDFQKILQKGYLEYRLGDGTTRVRPAFITHSSIGWGYDFRIAELNGERKTPKRRSVFISGTRKALRKK